MSNSGRGAFITDQRRPEMGSLFSSANTLARSHNSGGFAVVLASILEAKTSKNAPRHPVSNRVNIHATAPAEWKAEETYLSPAEYLERKASKGGSKPNPAQMLIADAFNRTKQEAEQQSRDLDVTDMDLLTIAALETQFSGEFVPHIAAL